VPQKSLHNAIQEWFEEHCDAFGTLEAVARGCLDSRVFPQEWMEQAVFAAAKREVHEALRARDSVTGLSHSIPTGRSESGVQQWRPRKLVGYDEWAVSFEMRVEQMADDYNNLKREHEWAMDRFGKAPPLPVFVRGKPGTNVG
jgi:hypothetical protein